MRMRGEKGGGKMMLGTHELRLEKQQKTEQVEDGGILYVTKVLRLYQTSRLLDICN